MNIQNIKFVALLAVFLMICSPANAADLAKEVQDLRILVAEQGRMIQELRGQIIELAQESDKSQAVSPSPEELDSQKKGLNVDYVGRYEGPFHKGGLIVENPSGFGNVSVGGYSDIEFENFEKSHSTFDQHRWIINVGAELNDRLRFYSEYEIEHGGTDAAGGGGESHVEQAWIDYLITDSLNIRAGALLVPFGRYNLYHDSDLQNLTDRPLVARRVIPTTWTESGAGLWGEMNSLFNNDNVSAAYQAYVINGLNSGFSDTGFRSATGSIETDNNNSKAGVGRFMLSPIPGQEVAVSGYWGRYNNSGDSIQGISLDGKATVGPVELLAEWAYFDIDEPAGSDVMNRSSGFYVQANYDFWFEGLNNTFLGLGFDQPTFTLVGRYDWANIQDDGDAGTGRNEENRWTLGFDYRPVESWVFKIEYQWNETDNETLERGNNDGLIGSVAMGF